MKFPEVDLELGHLEDSILAYRKVWGEGFKDGEVFIYWFDFLLFAAARRGCAIVKAFVQAVREDNHLVAPSLIRMHLDNLLTLYAAKEFEDGPEQFVMRRMEGKLTRQLKNRLGQRMHEKVLVDSFNSETQTGWIKGVYDNYSDYVHFGSVALHSIFQSLEDDGHFKSANLVSSEIDQVTLEDVLNWIVAMNSINASILETIRAFSDWKAQGNLGPTYQ